MLLWTIWGRCPRTRLNSTRRRLSFERLEGRIDPATIVVSPMAPDGTPHSLRGVLDHLNPNETNEIVLTPGTLHLTKGGLQIEGFHDLTIEALRTGRVTLDAGGLSQVFRIEASKVTLSDLTITDGRADFEGGAIAAYESMVAIEGSTITANTAATGGGIYASASTVTIDASTISENKASFGVGGWGAGMYMLNSSVTISGGSSIVGNTANYVGGGIASDHSTVIITGNSSVSRNTANVGGDGGGGGIVVWGGNVAIDDSTVSNNSAPFGGGIYAQSDSTVMITGDSTVSGNSADGRGGGLYILSSTVTIDSSTLSGNTADSCPNASGGVILVNTYVDGVLKPDGFYSCL